MAYYSWPYPHSVSMKSIWRLMCPPLNIQRKSYRHYSPNNAGIYNPLKHATPPVPYPPLGRAANGKTPAEAVPLSGGYVTEVLHS